MKTIIRNIQFFAVVLLLSATASCSDLLDQRPQGQWTLDDIEGGAAFSEVMALYADMRSYNLTTGIPAFLIHMVRSEDSCAGSTATDSGKMSAIFDNFHYDSSNGEMNTYWTTNYSVIHKVNTILAELDAKEGELSSAEQNLYSECCFFRAYCYFNLVRAFGEVPLIDFALENADDANVAKSSTVEIYRLIDSDLTRAETLPLEWESKYVGRITFGAARALHARTYMQRSDWGNMLAAAQSVISTQKYDLKTAYDKIFREEGENSSESVWELQCTATTALPESNDLGSQFCQVQGVRGTGENNLGWGWHMATAEITGAWEAGDPRKDETLLYYTSPSETWDQIVATLGAPADGNQPYNEKFAGNDEYTGRYFNKKAYCSKTMRDFYGSKSGFWYNVRLIRYSDVVLMAAEAACELGGETNITLAKEYLEQVRSRARGTNSSILPEVTTDDQETLRQAIRRERRAELALEPDRFYDLVRWGIAKEVLHAAGKTEYQDKHAYLPIPQTQIDASNGVLIQNPNYAN